MASLTPGVLSKLLQNLDNPTAKVAGDHRSALLQVIAILPQDDVFDFNKGFYLRVSDSLHSAYLSVSDPDLDLILTDKIQLGQFVYVTRLDSGSPVPVLRGLKPVPKRRPCVGDPKDLISSDSLLIRGGNRVDLFKKKKDSKVKVKESNGRRLSLVAGKIRDEPETRRLSLDYSSRKAWDRSPAPAGRNGGSGTKSRDPSSPLCSTPVRLGSVKKACPEKDIVLKQPNFNIPPLRNKNVIVSEKLIKKPIQKDLKSSFDCNAMPSHLNKVPVSVKTWSNSKLSWDFVSPTIRELGKEVICRRDTGFSTTVQALEETSAMENILQCMSLFAELCELADNSTNHLVERFLNLYQKIQTSAAVVNTLIESRSTDEKSPDHHKNVALWVQAALQTNLSKFCLYTKDNTDISRDDKSRHVIVLENTSEKTLIENHLPENKKSPKTTLVESTKKDPISRQRRAGATTKKTTSERVELSKKNGLQEAANLAEKLLLVSRKWFLNYLGESLKNGFGLKKGEEDSRGSIGILGQLKRVNRWLDDLVDNGNCVEEKVEILRKKLYVFLLDHVQKTGK